MINFDLLHRGALRGTVRRIDKLRLSPWLRAQIFVEEAERDIDNTSIEQIVIEALTDYYINKQEEVGRNRYGLTRSEQERVAYEARAKGMNWTGVARQCGNPNDPMKAMALAMCYAYRPMLLDKPPLPWPIF